MSTPAPGALARFQDGFANALLARDCAPAMEIAALAAQPGFAVYRNTVMTGCIDALQANYPAVARLVGEQWFRAAAAIYVREAPPREPMLVTYGAGFADFLGRFEPAAELPYLPGVARLDRYWTEAHCAATDEALDPAAFASVSPAALAGTVLTPHAAARWAWFAEMPIYTVWSSNRAEDPVARDIDWRGEGALITRPEDEVRWMALDAAGCALLDACAAGATAAAAVQAALEVEGDADLAKLMSILCQSGAFGDLKAAKPQPPLENGP